MPKAEPVTKEELQQLPREAIVTFAVRCAQRVYPVFERWAQEDPVRQEHLIAVDNAIRLSSNFDPHADAADAAYEAADAARAAARAARAGAPARADFAALLARARTNKKKPNAATFDPASLGPLWPSKTPDWWPGDNRVPPYSDPPRPIESDDSQRKSEAPDPTPQSFDVWIDPGDADVETLREVLVALSDLHEHATGYRLRYEESGTYQVDLTFSDGSEQ